MRNDAINMEVNEGLLAFGAEEEGVVAVIVDEEIYTRTAGGQGVAEEVEVQLPPGPGIQPYRLVRSLLPVLLIWQ